MLKIEGLDFPLSLALGYGLLLMFLRDMEVRSLNPALTLADILRGNIESAAGFLIIFAQFAGAALGAVFLTLLFHHSNIFPVTGDPIQPGRAMIVQAVFGTALTFAYFRGARGSKYDGLWLAMFLYSTYLIGGPNATCINPAMALGVNAARSLAGYSAGDSSALVLILMPMVGAATGVVLDKSSEQSLHMSELSGTLFLSFAILAASTKSAFPAFVGLALYNAAVVRMVSPVSGGSLNPAVTAGALLTDGRGITKDAVSIWLFQIAGGVLAAFLGSQAFDQVYTTTSLLSGDWIVFLVALSVSALLMLSYSVDFGDLFGSPAAGVVGAVYGLSMVAGKHGVPINPATSLGATIVGLFSNTAPVPLESAASVLVPVLGCMAGAALLRFVPAQNRRRL